MGMTNLGIVVFIAYSVVLLNLDGTSAQVQKMNLLEEYLRSYFSSYSPKEVRSYKLYGKGQDGAADHLAGLPYPPDYKGPVNSLIYSSGSIPQKGNLKNPLPGTIANRFAYAPSSGGPSSSSNYAPYMRAQQDFIQPRYQNVARSANGDTPLNVFLIAQEHGGFKPRDISIQSLAGYRRR